jgi:hypothetical protein
VKKKRWEIEGGGSGIKSGSWIEGIFAGIISVGWQTMDHDKDTKETVSGLLMEGVSFKGLEFQRVGHLSRVIWRRVRLTVSFQETVVRN